jgi:CheY-like chemotaxis protein
MRPGHDYSTQPPAWAARRPIVAGPGRGWPRSPASRYGAVIVEPDGSFAKLVHHAYAHLHDRVVLNDHPLAEVLGRGTPLSAERLHRLLTDAIEWLRPLGAPSPTSVEWRRYQHLRLRYLEGARPDEVERDLSISARQARRDLAEALDQVARQLWRRAGDATRAPQPAAASRSPELDAELAKLAVLESAPEQAEEIVAGVVDTIELLAAERGARILVDVRSPLPPVQVSRMLIRQLLLNLLTEAIVGETGSVLTLTVAEGPRGVAVTLAAATPNAGLAAAGLTWRRLVGDGAVAIELDDGQATTVRALLPTVPRTTVLVVDDNPDIGYLFQRYLAESPYRLVRARTGERALRLALEESPDIVILDVLMPSQDGWEILRALRAAPATDDLPVVICSVLPDRTLARSLGVREFLSKPVTRSALLELLSRIPPRTATRRRAPIESSAPARQREDHPAG